MQGNSRRVTFKTIGVKAVNLTITLIKYDGITNNTEYRNMNTHENTMQHVIIIKCTGKHRQTYS